MVLSEGHDYEPYKRNRRQGRNQLFDKKAVSVNNISLETWNQFAKEIKRLAEILNQD